MDKFTTILFAIVCVYLTCCHCSPIMVSEGTSGRKVFLPRPPRAKQIISKPYKDPAPVWEIAEPYTPRKYIVFKPKKYGFVNPKTNRIIPDISYYYNKRYIYGNYAHLNYV